MEAAALSLLLVHQSGVLNPLVDTLIAVYTIVVFLFVFTVHRQQKLLSKGIVPSDELVFESGHRPPKSRGRPAAIPAAADDVEDAPGRRPNLTGVWRTIPSKNVNYDDFLLFQGVPYLKRKIANSTVVTHTFHHRGNKLDLEVQPLNMKTTFNIDGEPTVSYIGKKAFKDTVTWGPKNELILVKKNEEDGVEILVTRIVKNKGKMMVMNQVAKNLKDGRVVEAEQTFVKD